MRDALTPRAIHILALVFVSVLNGSCDPCDSSLDPVKCSDLCEKPTPHKDCAKCTSIPRALECPQCQGGDPMVGCPNYMPPDGSVSDASTDGATDGDAMSGGAGGVGGGGSGGVGGVVGGTGGGGGDGDGDGDGDGGVGLLCDDNDDCPPAQAVCGEDNHCGPCTQTADCSLHAGALVCDTRPNMTTTGRCVDCMSDTECSSAIGRQCVLGFCVECGEDTDCTSLETPECGADYMCKGCTNNDACVGRGVRTMCDTRDGAPNKGECVECETHSDCEDEDKPQCDVTGTCVPCTNDDACDGRMDGAIAIAHCNTRADADTFGQCVQCTGATELPACPGDRACEQSSGRCTDNDVDSLYACDACEADSECRAGMKCVEVSFGAASIGTYCIWAHATNSTCADEDHIDMRPFSDPQMLPSVDGPSALYCLPPTTCEAFKSAEAGTDCDGEEDCGLNMNDGFCPTTGGAPFKCSYACETSDDCLETGISECPDVGVKFCRIP